jgi:polysaccharide deacetylase family protein (PEP-CTERM system associated)
MTLNALTIDVEEYFHAENLRAAYPRDEWDDLESRLDEPLDRLRELLRSRGVRATFFVLGWVAERHPGSVAALVRDGHEIASHGYGHELLTELDPERLREDLRRANRVLELCTRARPSGYRAPCFTITPATRWALPVLIEEGFAYDSSVFPIRHDRYGDPTARTDPHRIELGDGRSIAEAPPATVRLLGRNLPIAGGGYLRLLPWRACAAGIESLNARDVPAVVYLHPWELDSGQPPHRGAPLLKRVRHSIGTAGSFRKLERLLERFSFGTLETVLERRGLLSQARAARGAPHDAQEAERPARGGGA